MGAATWLTLALSAPLLLWTLRSAGRRARRVDPASPWAWLGLGALLGAVQCVALLVHPFSRQTARYPKVSCEVGPPLALPRSARRAG